MTSRPTPLTAASILDLFAEVSHELETRGEQGQLFVVGGAAMALEHDSARVTRDVDALCVPATVVRRAAEAVADRHPGLEPDWLNDGVKGAWARSHSIKEKSMRRGAERLE
jgi:hypothetical protein